MVFIFFTVLIEFTSDFEDQHGQNVHLEEDGVVQAKMCSNHDISESLLIDEIEQNDLPLKGVQIQGSCSPEIDKGENVKVAFLLVINISYINCCIFELSIMLHCCLIYAGGKLSFQLGEQ